jgi:hypothetical protein
MTPAPLLSKDENGHIVPYLSNETRWVDGSLTSDIPRNRVSSLFNVTNWIVSQVNPHIVPFISKTSPGSSKKTALSSIEELVMSDIRSRCLLLSKFGVIPNMFGSSTAQKVFTQNYLGNINVVPSLRFVDNFKAILNPSVADMQHYLLEGQRCTWPKLSHIKFVMSIEKCIARCLSSISADIPLSGDTISSATLTSESFRFATQSKVSICHSLFCDCLLFCSCYSMKRES